MLEFAVPASLLGGAPSVRVLADVNNTAFLPNDYSNFDFVVEAAATDPPVTHGAITLDGDLSDWTADKRLDTPETGAAGYALYGDLQDGHLLFAISADAATVGAGTTIWLDTDLDRATGYQIWGFTGGTEFNIEVAADGSAKLYAGGPGETFIADLETFRSADGTVLEIAVATADLGGATAARVFADVNNSAFLPNDYANVDIFVGDPPADPPPHNDASYRIGIVYSETTAAHF